MGSSSSWAWDEIMVKQWGESVLESEHAAADSFPFPQNNTNSFPLFFTSSHLQNQNFPSLHTSFASNLCDVGEGRLDGGGNDEDRKPPPPPLRVSTTRVTVKRIKAGRKKVRQPRFSFKTMSDVDVLDDGYKWRKYGQKVVKNTLHPRSYYRCTQDNCKVKKRVERLAEDPRMVITTYEGRHAHSPSLDNLEETTGQLSASHLNNFFW